MSLDIALLSYILGGSECKMRENCCVLLDGWQSVFLSKFSRDYEERPRGGGLPYETDGDARRLA